MAEKKCFTYSLLLLIQLPYHHFPTNYYLLIPISHYLENGRKNKKTLRKHGPFSQMLQFLMKDVVKDLKTLPEGDASEIILIPFENRERHGIVSPILNFVWAPRPKALTPPPPEKTSSCLGKVAVCLIVILLIASFFLLNLFFIIPMLIMWFREHECESWIILKSSKMNSKGQKEKHQMNLRVANYQVVEWTQIIFWPQVVSSSS